MTHHRIFIKQRSIVTSAAWLILSASLPVPSSAQPADGQVGLAPPSPTDPTVRTANTAVPGRTPEARPDLAVDGSDVSGEVGRPIPLKVSVRQTGDVTVEGIRLVGLPPGVIVGDQVHILKLNDGEDIVDLTDWNLSDLRITQPVNPAAQFKLTLSVIWKSPHSDPIEISSTEFAVRTVAVSEAIGADAKALERTVATMDGAAAPRRSSAKPALPGPAPPSADGTAMPGPVARAEPEREQVEPRPARPPETRAAIPSPSGTIQARPSEAGALVERAKVLIKRGDISGARLFLERARARNEPEATFLLAQTWDPEMLQRWNVLGLRPDPERARALYAEAAERSRGDDRALSTTRR